jgi:hypothetical protein
LGDETVKPTLEEISFKDQSPMVRYNAKKAIDNLDTYTSLQKEKKLKELKDKMKQEDKNKPTQ